MNITWLGQAGLLLETGGIRIIVDPYLSDNVARIQPENKRRVPVDPAFLQIQPDVLILTHDHLDHTDPETLAHYLQPGRDVLILASGNAYAHVRQAFPGIGNPVLFNRHSQWSQWGIRFNAVRAEHSDTHAIGVIIEAESKKYYITGDTLYNTEIFEDIPWDVDYVFLPVNGKGNNMNMADAARFCEKISARAIPIHCGLFDDLDLRDFPYENKIVPEFFKQIPL